MRIALVVVLAVCWPASAHAAPQVSLRSLLAEMIDRDAVARLAAPSYTLKQVSSHDPRKNDPGNPETWHSNTDYGNFLHVETTEGRREWVIFEDDHPGAIVRFWTPLLADNDRQTVRFYFDGSPKPAIVARFNDLMSGQGFVKPPLAYVAKSEKDLRDQLKPGFRAPRGVGGDLYLPIPYAKSCKITLDSQPFYYVIDHRVYPPGTAVRTFSMADFESAKAVIDRVSRSLLFRTARTFPPFTEGGTELGPGEETSIDLDPGPAAVHDLFIRLRSGNMQQALRSTVVRAEFDGEQTVWCPLSEFFGAGVRLQPVRDWWRDSRDEGAMSARWIMPYRRSARIRVKCLGPRVGVLMAVTSGPWKWDDRSLYFHATWRCQNAMKTRPMADWNYLEAQGSGKYVGDTLTVFSPVSAWYGEGDERIYVDGATFPAHIGTGTEDYYGYAWGMAGYFSAPFMSMPLRDRASQGDWQGYTTTSRLRSLDAIPFRTGIKPDMEIWNWADTKVDYAVGTFWYARPGAACNRKPQPEEAAMALSELPPPYKVPGAIEFETLPIVAKSDGLVIGTQDAGLAEGQWSGGQQLFVQARKVGDFVEMDLPVQGSGERVVTVYGTKSHDYGILRFTVNGERAGPDYDAYSATSVPTGPIRLGSFAPRDRKLRLRVEVVGANPASKGNRYYFGLDCVTAVPAPGM